MSGDTDAYLEACNEAVAALALIKQATAQLMNVANAIENDSINQEILSKLPTAEQIKALDEKVDAAVARAWQAYERVPQHLKQHLPKPDDVLT